MAEDPGTHNIIPIHPQHQSLPHQQHSQHISIHIHDDKNQSVVPIGAEDLHAQMMAAIGHAGLNGHSIHHHAMSHLDQFELPPMDPQGGGPHSVGYDSPYTNMNTHMMHPHHQPHPGNVLPPYADQQQVRISILQLGY